MHKTLSIRIILYVFHAPKKLKPQPLLNSSKVYTNVKGAQSMVLTLLGDQEKMSVRKIQRGGAKSELNFSREFLGCQLRYALYTVVLYLMRHRQGGETSFFGLLVNAQ